MLVVTKRQRIWFISIISVFGATVILVTASLLLRNVSADRQIIFPVLGGGTYSNDYNSPRGNGPHRAIDIFGAKHTPLVAAVDGVVTWAPVPQPSYGYMVQITDAEGYEYNYIHINNDNDGTDDGNGGPMKAYAPDIKQGNRVVKGQHIGWLGDSGNAESTAAHLHFEIYNPSGNPINPYNSLRAAPRINQPSSYPALSGEVLPYGPNIRTSVQMAAGDLDTDPQIEYITGAGAGGGPHVRVFNQDGSFSNYGFFAYADNFRGGVNVTVGDIDGDNKDEIITGTGPGSTSHVRIFEATGQYIGGFFAYPGYNTGVTVATGDMDGDGMDEIITGTSPGNTSHVKLFKANSTYLRGFTAYPGYNVGADVAAGDINGDGQDEIVTASGPGSSHVKIFTRLGAYTRGFFAYENFYGGVRLDVGNVLTSNSREEIMTAPYSRGGPDVRLFNDVGGLVDHTNVYESWWIGGYDVAAGVGHGKIGIGSNRRTSFRTAFN